ncbi:MAG: hypothetical protein Q4C73_02230 [Eubacteriales bacterium]|nr:hypothetical protein [Eubacteriales bacterium]
MTKTSKKLIIGFLLLCMLSVSAFAAEKESIKESREEAERIIGVRSTSFFEYMPGTFYIYFGRPTCPSCVVFEEHLNKFLQNTHWIVYYFNTAYWKEDPQYNNILRKYKIDGVPALIKTVDKELADTYYFDETKDDKEIAADLDAFFGEKTSGLFPVTSADNYPIQFSDNLNAFTFVLMLADVLFVCFRRKEILEKKLTSTLVFLVVTATILFLFHWVIAGFGFAFAIHYSAGPDTGFIAEIGKRTFLTVTPVLYVIVLITAAKLQMRISGI